MHVEYVDKLKVVLVPYWLQEALPTVGGIKQYGSLLNLAQLSNILNTDDIFNFLASQNKLKSLYNGAFSDIATINYEEQCTDGSIPDLTPEKIKAAIQDVESSKKNKERIERLKERRTGLSLIMADKAEVEEYYVPQLYEGEYLLLIGTPDQSFKDLRAFYNYLVEEVNSNGYNYNVFSKKLFFKHYLKHAIDN